MVDGRKTPVSIRMHRSDVNKLKKLAQRLGVRDSDVIRYAVKSMFGRIGPLFDSEVRGRQLVPVFVESGVELLRFFDLDATRLESIINAGVEADRRVDHEDIALLALTGIDEPYAALLLSELNQRVGALPGSSDLEGSVRRYLYDKYVYRTSLEPHGNTKGAAVAGVHHGQR